MTKIMIADGHVLLRESLKRAICSKTDMEVICEAKDALEVFLLLKKHKVSMIILDIDLPGSEGLDILCNLKTKYPAISVLILSVSYEEQFIRKYLKAGALGYLNKDIEPDEFISAIMNVAHGHTYFNGFVEKTSNKEKEMSGWMPEHKRK